jgi:hypothetical protein
MRPWLVERAVGVRRRAASPDRCIARTVADAIRVRADGLPSWAALHGARGRTGVAGTYGTLPKRAVGPASGCVRTAPIGCRSAVGRSRHVGAVRAAIDDPSGIGALIRLAVEDPPSASNSARREPQHEGEASEHLWPIGHHGLNGGRSFPGRARNVPPSGEDDRPGCAAGGEGDRPYGTRRGAPPAACRAGILHWRRCSSLSPVHAIRWLDAKCVAPAGDVARTAEVL